MTKRLDGTVAVTGASSCIGEATSRVGEEGAAVALVARRRDRLEALAGRIGGAGPLVIEADITDPEQAQRAIDTTVAERGRLDVLVNNAGVMLLGPIVGAPRGVAAHGAPQPAGAAVLHACRIAAPAPGGGVRSHGRWRTSSTCSSVAGRVARLDSGVYNVTKHGVGAFSESLRQEVTAPATCGSRSSSRERRPPSWRSRTARRSSRGWPRTSPASRSCTPKTSPRASGMPSPNRGCVAVNEILVRPTEQER